MSCRPASEPTRINASRQARCLSVGVGGRVGGNRYGEEHEGGCIYVR